MLQNNAEEHHQSVESVCMCANIKFQSSYQFLKVSNVEIDKDVKKMVFFLVIEPKDHLHSKCLILILRLILIPRM